MTKNLVGAGVTEGQIEASRSALLQLYRSQGYIYTTVQAIIRGSDLRLQVVEGYVSEVKLDGDVGPAGEQVLRFLRHLVGQVPLKTTQLERWLLLAQDIPGLTVRSVLNPSLGDPGALTLVAQVSRRPVSGYISADNRAYELSGPEEGLGVFNLDSFTSLGERTQISLFGTFSGTNLFGQVSEEFFLGGSGLKLKLYAGVGRSTPSGALAVIDYVGDTRVAGGLLSYPLLRTREHTLGINLAFDAVESNVNNNLGPNGATQRSSYDSLRILRLGADYALLDSLFGPDRTGVNSALLRISQGLTAFGATRDGDTTTPPPRVGEKVDFKKFYTEFSRTQALGRLYGDAAVSVALAGFAQYSNDLLPPEEKAYLGGPTFNRGYYYGQVTGDKAVSLSAELRLTTPVSLPRAVPWDLSAQFYTFYNWGTAWQNTSLESDVALRSAGGGVRLFVASSTEVDLEGAYRISLYPTGQGPGVSALRSAAFYWQVLQRF